MSEQNWFGASVYYSSDGYNTSGTRLMGRQAAGHGFLRAYVERAQSQSAQASAWVTSHTSEAVREAHQGFARAGLRSRLQVLTPATLGHLRHSGCLYVPQPGLHDLAWQRARVGERTFSLCGVTHTTASHAVMDALSELPASALRPWDAIICTSSAVLQTVEKLVARRMDYLRWKLGANRLELPMLPVIPLGVHSSDFIFSAQERVAARQLLQIEANDVVVLFVGRLSFHAKAHPHPMLRALQKACVDCDKRVHLVQAGWFANEAIQHAFEEASQVLSPNVVHHFLDARHPDRRRQAWACADIFCSLSDNIQETFGLTPVEAMSAGLPCVVSDWDGYKETVRDGVDGFRVSTFMPQPGDGQDLAVLYERGLDNYDMYCGKSCELVAVDLPQATRALSTLITSEPLRRQMGLNGRERVKQVFEWSVVMRQYEKLWAQMAERRLHPDHQGSIADASPLISNPSRPDPYDLFSGYPTRSLTDESFVELLQPVDKELFNRMVGLKIHKFAGAVLPSWEQAKTLLAQLSQSPVQLKDIFGQADINQRRQLRRHLLWMAKVGWLTVF